MAKKNEGGEKKAKRRSPPNRKGAVSTKARSEATHIPGDLRSPDTGHTRAPHSGVKATDPENLAGGIRLPDQLEYRSIDELAPYDGNPRTHTEEQVAKIAVSLLEFGWTNPILVDEKGGIIAGHGRLLAARAVGMITVPVIELAHLTEAQKRAYMIADNRLALDAGWDEDLLASELKTLELMEFDLALTGFELNELEAILDPAPPSRSAGTRAPTAPVHPCRREWWRSGCQICSQST